MVKKTKSKAGTWMTVREFAKARGVARTYAYKLVQRGRVKSRVSIKKIKQLEVLFIKP